MSVISELGYKSDTLHEYARDTVFPVRYELTPEEQLAIETQDTTTTDCTFPCLRDIDVYEISIIIDYTSVATRHRNFIMCCVKRGK